MISSRKTNRDIILEIYRQKRTVFKLNDLAMLLGTYDFQSLNKKINYYVRSGKLNNPRKGIYTKPDYDREELACSVFTPSYISLQYVLMKKGILFQYDSRITCVSYLSRNLDIESRSYEYRKIKNSALVNTSGIIRHDNHVNIASAERAFLDLLYLEKDYHFDNLNPLNRKAVNDLLPLYGSKALTQAVKKIFGND